MTHNCGHTATYFYGNGLCFNSVSAHFQSHHTGFGVYWFVLVEDEIAHAVVYLFAVKVLNAL